ncbi:MAG: hypothetical protein ACKVOH_06130 [Chlamydiales bacterium]
MVKKSIVLSFSDLFSNLRVARYRILGCALAFGLLLFCYKATRPYSYTAKAIFKTASSEPRGVGFASLFSAAPEKFTKEEAPFFFMTSPPVLEKVVKRLRYQGSLFETKKGCGKVVQLLRNIVSSLRIEKAVLYQKKHPAPAPFGCSATCIAKILFPDPSASLELSSLIYNAPTYTYLELRFINETQFEVLHEQTLLGCGRLDLPFDWEGSSFTVHACEEVFGKSYFLSLIPMNEAIASIKKAISLSAHPEHHSSINISVTHPNRFYAATVVNTVMEEYQAFLRESAEKKVIKQLDYLHKREETAFAEMQALAVRRKEKTLEQLEYNNLPLTENPANLLSAKAGAATMLTELGLELQLLYETFYQERLPLTTILEKVEQPDLQLKADIMDYDTGMEKLTAIEKKINASRSKILLCKEILHLIEEKKTGFPFLTDAMLSLINDNEIKKLNKLFLLPASEKMEMEKKYQEQKANRARGFIQDKVSLVLQDEEEQIISLQKNLFSCQKRLLFTLAHRYQTVERNYADILKKSVQAHDIELVDKSFKINQEMQTRLLEELLSTTEAKNLSYNLENLDSEPLIWASAPALPNLPHLSLFTTGGALFGVFASVGWILLQLAWQGPSASRNNLLAQGRIHLGDEGKCWEEILHYVSTKRPLCFCGKREVAIPTSLKKENMIRLSSLDSEEMTQQIWGFSGEVVKPKIQVITCWEGPYALATHRAVKQAEAVVYFVTDERLDDLSKLPDHTAFVTAQTKRKERIPLRKLTLTFLQPSFSSQEEKKHTS